MAFQNINIGVSANDGTGDPDRTAFDKINQNFSSIDNINKLFTSAASDLTGLAAELNALDPPLVIGENEIFTFKLLNGDLYQMLNKGKGTYGIEGVTNLVAGDFNQITFPATGLEQINEGNGIGWRLKGRNPSFYGNIGLNATDISLSTSVGNFGAIGSASFASGENNVASGIGSHSVNTNNNATANRSFASGNNTSALGIASHTEGEGTIASGTNSHAEGNNTIARANGEHSGGRFGTDYTLLNDGTDRIINYGIGEDTNNRVDGLTLFRNGALRIFRATLASITNAASGFFIFDSEKQNRPSVHDGTDWKHLQYVTDTGIGDMIVNPAVDEINTNLIVSPNPTIDARKWLKKSIRDLQEDELLNELSGVFLPEASTISKLFNVLNPAIQLTFSRNTVKYGHKESGLIVEYPINTPAICHLYGKPELIVEPQRTNLVLNSEPIANENGAAGVVYQTETNNLGINDWFKMIFNPSATVFRYAGTVLDNDFYEQSFFLKVPTGFEPKFLNTLLQTDSYFGWNLRGNTNAVRTSKFENVQISENLWKVSMIDNPRGFVNNNNNGIVVVSSQPPQRDIIATGQTLSKTTDDGFIGSYIKTTGTTKTVDPDVITVTNAVTNGLLGATEGTLIMRGTFREYRIVWTGGNKVTFIDNAQIGIVAELPSDAAFNLDTSSYRVAEILFSTKALLP